ncbi:hypothetical protein BJY00DRAFT_198611 [Aspergillus carlsbadensis]|nr:hypothetical protein BJY00DRAFT_198611 [Aspergillus carlsbadensis]
MPSYSIPLPSKSVTPLPGRSDRSWPHVGWNLHSSKTNGCLHLTQRQITDGNYHVAWPSTSSACLQKLMMMMMMMMMSATDVEPADLFSTCLMSTSLNTQTSSPTGGEPGRPPGNIQTDRSMDRHHGASVEDYSRIMLEYTQRRMAGFADPGNKGYASSRSSRASNGSGQSGTSTSGGFASQAAGQVPPKIRHNSDDDSSALAAGPAV